MKILPVFMFCVVFSSHLWSQSRSIYKKVNIPITENQNLKDLQNLGLSLICGSEHIHTENQESIILVLGQNEVESLRSENISFEIIEEDLSRKIEERNKVSLPIAKRELEELKINQVKRGADVGQDLGCVEQEWSVPINFNLGSMGGMLTYQELLDELDDMAMKFPNLISIRASASTSLTTIEGREIQYVRISDNPAISEQAEPQVLYTALHHAREPVSMMSLIYYMWYLLENYATDTEIKTLVDHTEMLFIPCINVDGYLYNESTDPNGGGYWRKNRRLVGTNKYGVDLNRNYSYQWGIANGGSSNDPSSQVYHGAYAFSEPETQIIKEFVEARNIITTFNNHTSGNLNLYPWGYTSDGCPDDLLYHEMTEQMCWHNRYIYGQGNTTIYPVAGVSDDWFYGEQTAKNKIMAWTPEVGLDGFWPDPSLVVSQSQNQMRMNLQLASMATNYGVLNDLTEINISSLNPAINFSVQHLSNVPGAFTIDITPISPEILSISNSTLTSSVLSDSDYDDLSTSMTLDPTTGVNTAIEYEVTMNNGAYDMFTRRYIKRYNPDNIFYDSFDDGNKWTLGSWEIDATEGHKASGSLTDSENGLSEDGYIIATSIPIDLSNSINSKLQYYTKWDINGNYDFAQIQLSSDGLNWSDQCGTYTKRGTGNGRYNTDQHPEDALYDGIQEEWVREEFDISVFDGNASIFIRFIHYGDKTEDHRDGIFIDDLSIYSTAPAHCIDGVLNADETDIDCGGFDCGVCPTCSDGIQNGDEADIDCGGSNCEPCVVCETINLVITLDDNPTETAWVLNDENSETITFEYIDYNSTPGATIIETFCLLDGCYEIVLYDAHGDGICCEEGNGSYTIFGGDGSIIGSGGDFAVFDTTFFCITKPFSEHCIFDLDLPAYPDSTYTYYSEHDISSDGTVVTDFDVTISAGNEIYINEGFEVISGATFHALIGGCTK